jgi:predicted RNase H-like HicB family nuclease
MSAQKFTILLKPAPEGGFTVHCVEVPISCHGKTKEEALKNIKEAIESLGWKLTQNY